MGNFDSSIVNGRLLATEKIVSPVAAITNITTTIILPTNTTSNIGSSTNFFNNIYANNINTSKGITYAYTDINSKSNSIKIYEHKSFTLSTTGTPVLTDTDFYGIVKQIDKTKYWWCKLLIRVTSSVDANINQFINVTCACNDYPIISGFNKTQTVYSSSSGILRLRMTTQKTLGTDYYGYVEVYPYGTNERTFEITMLEGENCSLIDPILSVYNSTYNNNTLIACSDNGTIGTNFKGTANAATYLTDATIRLSNNRLLLVGGSGIFPYCLFGVTADNKLSSFTTSGGNGTAKTFNSATSFVLNHKIFYFNTNSTIANNGTNCITSGATFSQICNADLRYSCNCGSSTFEQYKEVFLNINIKSDGTYTVGSAGIVQSQSLVSGQFYILLGQMHNESKCTMTLYEDNPVFYYNGTNLIPYTYKAEYSTTAGSANSVDWSNIQNKPTNFYTTDNLNINSYLTTSSAENTYLKKSGISFNSSTGILTITTD